MAYCSTALRLPSQCREWLIEHLSIPVGRTLACFCLAWLTTHHALAEDSTKWQATIERDRWGVPHVHGKTDADAAFGLAYAQAEDTWDVLQNTIPYYRGTAGGLFGPDGARSDFLVHWLNLWGTLDARYEQDLSPATRRYVEAFAAGFNQFAADHPQRVTLDILPITGKDIVAAHMLRHLFFYGFDKTVKAILGEDQAKPVSPPPVVAQPHQPTGSNAIAVGPTRSSDGSTMLVINPHQPLTGPVAWYEAHVQSDEGLNVMGGLFPGAPAVGVGFTPTTAWGATVNQPDLVDVYKLEMHPNEDYKYRYDDQWLELERKDVNIDVLIWGFIPWSVTETVYRSVHGPVLESSHGWYAVRYAGMDELRQVAQWLAMNKARNFEEWRAAVALNYIQSFNFVYAGKDRTIYFVHNATMPERARGWQWQQYLPGDRSELVWHSYLPFSELPHIENPPSGFILSTNQSPFHISAPGSNPDVNAYPAESGWPTRMTNRAVRGLELFEGLETVSPEQLLAIKHDNQYSPNYRGMAYLRSVLALSVDDPNLASAQVILRRWNRATDVDNRSAPLGVCILLIEWDAERLGLQPPPPQEALTDCVDKVKTMAGRLDPTWGEVNRHGRADVHLPLAGGPDTLRAAYAGDDHKDHRHVTAGDGLYYLVRWDSTGQQDVLGVHQYGNHFDDPSHPHYQDQVRDYVAEKLHPVLFTAEQRQGAIAKTYTVTQTR